MNEAEKKLKELQGRRLEEFSAEQMWREYEILVLDPIKASEVQRLESKKVMFSTTRYLIEKIGTLGEHYGDDEEAAAAHLQRIYEECERFQAEQLRDFLAARGGGASCRN